MLLYVHRKRTIWDGREAHLDFHNSSWSPQSAEAVNGWGGREQECVCRGGVVTERHRRWGQLYVQPQLCPSGHMATLFHSITACTVLVQLAKADARLAGTANKRRRRHWVNRGQRCVHNGRGRSGVPQWASLTVTQADVEMTHLLPLYPHPTCSAQVPSAPWRPPPIHAQSCLGKWNNSDRTGFEFTAPHKSFLQLIHVLKVLMYHCTHEWSMQHNFSVRGNKNKRTKFRINNPKGNNISEMWICEV